MALGALLAVVLAIALAHPAEGFEIVNDVKSVMYEEQKHVGGCYKLLNVNGEIGCAAPVLERNFNGRPLPSSIQGKLLHADDLGIKALTEDRVLVVNATDFAALMSRLLADKETRAHVMAVLVDSSKARPPQQSFTTQFPNAWNAPYAAKDYNWNPWGNGLELQVFNIPVLEMTPSVSPDVAQRALFNEHSGYSSAREWAEIELTMDAEKNSYECLVKPPNNPASSVDEIEGPSCQPLGGWSVWTAMPPMVNGPQRWSGNGPLREFGGPLPGNGKSITLVVAQVDSSGFFHDTVAGAGSPMSGLVAMLTAMDLLRIANATTQYTRQLAFVALAGEPWDYMGSRKMIKELDINSTSVRGLEIDLIDQIIELGMIGRATNETTNDTRLYMHSQPAAAGFGDAQLLLDALTTAASNTSEFKVSAQRASSSNPGIPPSSLMSFLRRNKLVKGVVLTEYDKSFNNPYTHSSYDGPDYVAIEALASTAILLARTLHNLASVGAVPPVPPLTVDAGYVYSRALALAQCLMIPSEGATCAITQAMMRPDMKTVDGYTPPAFPHYIGVLTGQTAEYTNTTFKPNIYRFLYNFMANASAVGTPGWYCDPSYNYCPAGQACVFWRTGTSIEKNNGTMGRCRNTTVSFVPAYSTRLVYNDTPNADYNFTGLRLRVWPDDTEYNTKYGWPADPLWTESNWPITTPYLRVYLRETREALVGTLSAGVVLTVATGVVGYYVRRLFERHLSSLRI